MPLSPSPTELANQSDELRFVRSSTTPSERVIIPSVVPWPLTALMLTVWSAMSMKSVSAPPVPTSRPEIVS